MATVLFSQLTVDGNSDTLAKGETVLSDEGRKLAKTVGLEVLSSRGSWLNDFEVEIKAIGLGNSLDGNAARVVAL